MAPYRPHKTSSSEVSESLASVFSLFFGGGASFLSFVFCLPLFFSKLFFLSYICASCPLLFLVGSKQTPIPPILASLLYQWAFRTASFFPNPDFHGPAFGNGCIAEGLNTWPGDSPEVPFLIWSTTHLHWEDHWNPGLSASAVICCICSVWHGRSHVPSPLIWQTCPSLWPHQILFVCFFNTGRHTRLSFFLFHCLGIL